MTEDMTSTHPQKAAGESFAIQIESIPTELASEYNMTSFTAIDLSPTFKGETEEQQAACQVFLDALVSTCHNIVATISLSEIQKYLESGAKVSACRFRLNGELIFEVQITKE